MCVHGQYVIGVFVNYIIIGRFLLFLLRRLHKRYFTMRQRPEQEKSPASILAEPFAILFQIDMRAVRLARQYICDAVIRARNIYVRAQLGRAE